MSTEKVKSACSECRRSKLKCDRNFPCQQCIKRGCSGICPFGVLPATKGNKTLMAQTHKLEEQVKALSARNRHLESALAHTLTLAHSSAWPEISCHTALVADDERSGLEAIVKDLQTLLQPEEMSSDDKLVELPYELLELMHAFPYGLKGHSYSKLLFIPFIPSFERANELFRLHKDLNSSDSLINEGFEATFGSIYHARKYVNIDTLHPHALSVFFMLMAHGSLLVDDTEEASRYVALARAAISLAPIAQEASVDTVHALIMMNALYLPSHGIETESRWMLIGITVKITQRIGLYRDSTGWNMSEDEQQRRRTLFWEVYCSDLWASIVMGRPPAMSIQHTDCRFPDENTRSIKTGSGIARPVSDYHKWKFHFFAECLSVVSQHCFNIRQPSFSSALETDRMIRAFPTPFLPPVSDDETELSWSSDPREAIQQALGACFRESSFLHLHKAFFAPVIVDQSLEPLEHKYCFSVLAVYRSSVRLVLYVQGVYFRYPECSQRSWPLWANVYRACLTFALTVIKRPDSKLAPDALRELTKAVALFAEGSKKCRPSHYMSIMEHLLEKAQSVANSVSSQSMHLAPKLANSAASTPSPGTEIFPMNMNPNTTSDHVIGLEASNFWPTNHANAIPSSAYFDENQYLPSDGTQSQFYEQAPPAYFSSPQTMTLESLLGPELSNSYSYDMTASDGNFTSLFNGMPG